MQCRIMNEYNQECVNLGFNAISTNHVCKELIIEPTGELIPSSKMPDIMFPSVPQTIPCENKTVNSSASPETTTKRLPEEVTASPEPTSKRAIEDDTASPEPTTKRPLEDNTASPEPRSKPILEDDTATPEPTSKRVPEHDTASPEQTTKRALKDDTATPEPTTKRFTEDDTASPEPSSKRISEDDTVFTEPTIKSIPDDKQSTEEKSTQYPATPTDYGGIDDQAGDKPATQKAPEPTIKRVTEDDTTTPAPTTKGEPSTAEPITKRGTKGEMATIKPSPIHTEETVQEVTMAGKDKPTDGANGEVTQSPVDKTSYPDVKFPTDLLPTIACHNLTTNSTEGEANVVSSKSGEKVTQAQVTPTDDGGIDNLEGDKPTTKPVTKPKTPDPTTKRVSEKDTASPEPTTKRIPEDDTATPEPTSKRVPEEDTGSPEQTTKRTLEDDTATPEPLTKRIPEDDTASPKPTPKRISKHETASTEPTIKSIPDGKQSTEEGSTKYPATPTDEGGIDDLAGDKPATQKVSEPTIKRVTEDDTTTPALTTKVGPSTAEPTTKRFTKGKMATIKPSPIHTEGAVQEVTKSGKDKPTDGVNGEVTQSPVEKTSYPDVKFPTDLLPTIACHNLTTNSTEGGANVVSSKSGEKVTQAPVTPTDDGGIDNLEGDKPTTKSKTPQPTTKRIPENKSTKSQATPTDDGSIDNLEGDKPTTKPVIKPATPEQTTKRITNPIYSNVPSAITTQQPIVEKQTTKPYVKEGTNKAKTEKPSTGPDDKFIETVTGVDLSKPTDQSSYDSPNLCNRNKTLQMEVLLYCQLSVFSLQSNVECKINPMNSFQICFEAMCKDPSQQTKCTILRAYNKDCIMAGFSAVTTKDVCDDEPIVGDASATPELVTKRAPEDKTITLEPATKRVSKDDSASKLTKKGFPEYKTTTVGQTTKYVPKDDSNYLEPTSQRISEDDTASPEPTSKPVPEYDTATPEPWTKRIPEDDTASPEPSSKRISEDDTVFTEPTIKSIPDDNQTTEEKSTQYPATPTDDGGIDDLAGDKPATQKAPEPTIKRVTEDDTTTPEPMTKGEPSTAEPTTKRVTKGKMATIKPSPIHTEGAVQEVTMALAGTDKPTDGINGDVTQSPVEKTSYPDVKFPTDLLPTIACHNLTTNSTEGGANVVSSKSGEKVTQAPVTPTGDRGIDNLEGDKPTAKPVRKPVTKPQTPEPTTKQIPENKSTKSQATPTNDGGIDNLKGDKPTTTPVTKPETPEQTTKRITNPIYPNVPSAIPTQQPIVEKQTTKPYVKEGTTKPNIEKSSMGPHDKLSEAKPTGELLSKPTESRSSDLCSRDKTLQMGVFLYCQLGVFGIQGNAECNSVSKE